MFSDIQDIVLNTLKGLNGSVMAYGPPGLISGFSLAHLSVCDTDIASDSLYACLVHQV